MKHFVTWMALIGLCVLVTCTPLRAAEPLPLKSPRKLAANDAVTLTFDLKRRHAAALAITLAEADFAGASLLVKVNGRNLPPYHAFGGDTRYDNVKGRADLHPPIQKIEANYVLVADWVNAGTNTLTVTNAGPGAATLGSITVREVSGHDLPMFQNPIHFDFGVWLQGVTIRPGMIWNLDLMIQGVLPGGGDQVLNYSGGDTMPLKLLAEDARVNWGYGRTNFYSIWHLVSTTKEWCQFIDVDQNPATPVVYGPDGKELTTTGKIHVQFANAADVPKGTEIALIKPDGYLNVLKPGIDSLLAYSSDYNLTCEQWGPRGQGFGRWWGDNLAAQGYDAKKWADNYQTEFSKVTKYIHEKNPDAPVMAPHWWIPDIRFLLYDTSLERGFKMRDMTDEMMTHYYSFPFAGYTPDGKRVMDDEKGRAPVGHPELEYPGGAFGPPDWDKSRPYMGTYVLVPEIAIDWNRYRLSRTEKDLLPEIDKQKHRWANGKPFNFQAGFDGDELSYNNEIAVYDNQYSGPAPYQLLYTLFSYSLLPTAGGEASQFKITRSLPLTPAEQPPTDIFGETTQPVNRYGSWVEGAAGTHRLKTRDPLYGDMFGYTGFEYAAGADYIWLGGVRDPQHRREPNNAYSLIRRMCYAYVTTAPIYPAIINDADTNQLFVKTLLLKQDGREVIGVYGVNFHDAPHKLDVSLPVGWTAAATSQVFDEKAADWADAKEVSLTPQNGLLQVSATLPARGPWCMFIYPPEGDASRVFTPISSPQPLWPWGNGNVALGPVVLRWRASLPPAGMKMFGSISYEVQVAREMLFREQDIMATEKATNPKWLVTAKLEPNHRYHWRVRAIDGSDNSTTWSHPQSFWFQAAPGAAGATPATVKGDAPAEQLKIPRYPKHELKPFTDADNLAAAGTPFAWPQFWEGPGKAIDGFADTAWVADDNVGDEGRAPLFPAWWAVRFDKEQAVSKIILQWRPDGIARDFEVQTWDGKAWKSAKAVKGNTQTTSTITLDAPVPTRAVRLYITAPVAKTVALAEAYVK